MPGDDVQHGVVAVWTRWATIIFATAPPMQIALLGAREPVPLTDAPLFSSVTEGIWQLRWR
jgi:hypothetical protein